MLLPAGGEWATTILCLGSCAGGCRAVTGGRVFSVGGDDLAPGARWARWKKSARTGARARRTGFAAGTRHSTGGVGR
eukprot:7303209-Prymnesium_polylepis.2